MILSAKYRARLSSDSTDIDRAVSLRKAAFRTDERDSIDDRAEQLLVEDAETGALAACLRLLTLEDGTAFTLPRVAGAAANTYAGDGWIWFARGDMGVLTTRGGQSNCERAA